ncbi:hypothetical protein E2C01_003580 [Portunus trituberculatus]|uniref:Uncharacterized protein n=1 Tax=Portunus trituberculatus TaxID=210409 RepID=A0A5B7CRN1_PORTR|nr:hypothetical protein [Portunus trituberculatus]
MDNVGVYKTLVPGNWLVLHWEVRCHLQPRITFQEGTLPRTLLSPAIQEGRDVCLYRPADTSYCPGKEERLVPRTCTLPDNTAAYVISSLSC